MEDTKKTGTTTVGLKYSEGVVLVSDQKATLGYMVDGKEVRKVYKITDQIGMTIAGSVGDVQALIRLLKAELNIYEMQRGEPIAVKSAATLTSNVLQGSKMIPYMGQFILGGYDTEPRLFTLDPIGGLSDSNEYSSTGSGSPFAYGVLEDSYEEGMDLGGALRVALRAVRAAKERDIASGGKGFNVAVIDRQGYRELNEAEIEKFITQ